MAEISQSKKSVVDIHRLGEFWLINTKTYKASISRIDLYRVAKNIGFCLFRGDIYRIVGKYVCKTTDREFQDILKAYIEEDPQLDEVINTFEAFMQKSCSFTISRLPIMHDEMFLNDDEVNCFKFFKNCFIQVTPTEVVQYDYTQIPENKYVLFSKVQQRDYKYSNSGLYFDFLSKATAWDRLSENIKTIIGYLSHEFKDETTAFIIVLTEQCPDPKDGGGSGKNLFCNLLSHTTTYCSKNGKQITFDEKFFQLWGGQRIMGISDVPKNFDFEFLKEPSSGTFTLKKLFKDEIIIPVADGPKFIVQTNYSYEITDGGLKRRIIPIEFTDFFTKAGGVDVHFGKHFPKGWSENDWNNFDTIIIDSVQTWLKSNRKIQSVQLTTSGWEKQFEHTHGKNIADFIRENFDKWVKEDFILSADISASLKSFYVENDVTDKKYHKSAQGTASAIKEWSHRHGVECFPNKQRQVPSLPGISGMVNKKCYIFHKTVEYQPA